MPATALTGSPGLAWVTAAAARCPRDVAPGSAHIPGVVWVVVTAGRRWTPPGNRGLSYPAPLRQASQRPRPEDSLPVPALRSCVLRDKDGLSVFKQLRGNRSRMK